VTEEIGTAVILYRQSAFSPEWKWNVEWTLCL